MSRAYKILPGLLVITPTKEDLFGHFGRRNLSLKQANAYNTFDIFRHSPRQRIKGFHKQYS
jgi:hypothetical protein